MVMQNMLFAPKQITWRVQRSVCEV